MSGLGVRSVCILAPSAFLASAAVMLQLQEAILPEPLSHIDDLTVSYALSVWKTFTPNAEPSDAIIHIQRAWDSPVVSTLTFKPILTVPVNKPRFKAVAALHAGNWLNAPPITTVVLCLSDKWI